MRTEDGVLTDIASEHSWTCALLKSVHKEPKAMSNHCPMVVFASSFAQRMLIAALQRYSMDVIRGLRFVLADTTW